MDFKDKYTTSDLSATPGEDKKTVISVESFAVCEMLDKLFWEIKKGKIKWR